MTSEKTYNGWENYETWCVNLWLDNDEGSQRYWAGQAQDCWDSAEEEKIFTREENAVFDLAKRLQSEFEESNPVSDQSSVWSDLMNAALSEVDWREIAGAMIENVDKTGDEEDAE